ncbi:MAG: peptide chain release factor N(5)-glutamine methyltransferase [Thermodesulfovibrionales bacterium]
MRAIEKIREAARLLREEGIPSHEKEAEALVGEALSRRRVSLLRDDPELDTEQESRIDEFVQRRLRGEPFHYIVGHIAFHGLMIRVGPGVLIPRPETEELVEEVLREWREFPAPLILDLCTGSGCIALALGAAIPSAEITGVDASARALSYASENAALNRVENVRFLRGDLFAPVEGSNFHVVVSNPPYVRLRDIASLQREIRDWEPLEALAAGESGLDYYERIMGGLRGYLVGGGKCYLEIGHDQRDAIRAICGANGFRSVFKRDMGGRDRIAVVSR